MFHLVIVQFDGKFQQVCFGGIHENKVQFDIIAAPTSVSLLAFVSITLLNDYCREWQS